MEKGKSNKTKLKGKRRKPLHVKVADSLIELHDRNEKLKEKKIDPSFLKLF